jgi:hypothetical protein
VCLPRVRTALGRFLLVAPGSIETATSTGSNAMPQCTYVAHVAAGSVIRATANVSTAPQPYYVLERTTVEATQVFGPTRMPATPVVVTGLGLEATWFPDYTELMSTDGRRLITVSVGWRGATQARELALAETMSRPYLSTPAGKRASARARGAPAP